MVHEPERPVLRADIVGPGSCADPSKHSGLATRGLRRDGTQRLRDRHDDVFALDAPDQAEATVDWAFPWSVYREFATVRPDREELAIGVIGYD